MDRSEFYCLTVALWPHAVEAGVQPVKTDGFENGPQFYRPHEFHFANPPTRQDWWALCAQTPWMAVFREVDKPVIDANPWPLVGPGMKSCGVELKNDRGQVVGRLSVRLQHCHLNPCPMVPHIGVDIRDRCLRGLHGQQREDARLWIMTNENWIQELAMAEDKPITHQLLVGIGKRLLRQAGLIKAGAKAAQAPACAFAQ
jgi:hypothetical protein